LTLTVHIETKTLQRRLLDAAAIWFAAALSLILLLFVAYSDAKRTSEQFSIEKLSAQGQVVQAAIEAYVRPGLPLRQFVGFSTLVEPAVEADPLIASVSVFDMSGAQIFVVGTAKTAFVQSAGSAADSGADVRISLEALQVALPIRDRFEQVGFVVIDTPRRAIAAQVQNAFLPLAGLAGLASLALALGVFLLPARLPDETRFRWVGFGFLATFGVIATVSVATLIGIYSEGAQSRAKSLASSLGQRLDDIVAYNLRFEDITGIGKLFADYQQANPDIRAAALIADGRVVVHTDRAREGASWDSQASDYEFTADLSAPDSVSPVQVRITLPRDVVVQQVIRSTKNFAALLVASGLFAAMSIGVVRALQRRKEAVNDPASEKGSAVAIALVKPAFFLAMFSEHLCYAFLPQLIQASATASGLPSSYASAPFTAYYLVFAAALMVAGRLERIASARTLMVAGLTLTVCGMLLMAGTVDLWSMTVARGLSGAGQGTLFIGTQAYILVSASKAHRTRAGGIIVFGFQAGMVAGLAIGSLLVASIEPRGVFMLAAIAAGATMLYVRFALPAPSMIAQAAPAASSLRRDIAALMRDGVFARTVLLVGVPAKALLTGVVLFGLPLLLARHGYAREDIGQITMLYAGAVMLASALASARADKTSDTQTLLFQGACLAACGLGLIAAPGLASLLGWPVGLAVITPLVVSGVVVIGMAHGMINAPIVTHVVDADVAARVGATSTAATYRLLERAGHVAGPMLMAQAFILFGQSWSAFAAIGVVVFTFGLIFQAMGRGKRSRQIQMSPA
jgi:MFS family permease